MIDALPFLASGMLLGLSGGLTPGPVLTLVITHTLQHDFREGLKIAIAPLLTDAPIILLTLLVFSRLSNFDALLGTITLVGAIYLAYLARKTFAASPIDASAAVESPRSIRTGFLANALNPSPYLFWSLVGTPTLYRALETSILAGVLFLGGLFLCLVGGKIAVAGLAARGRAYLQGRAFRVTLRLLGVALGLFALVFLWSGLGYFGVVNG